MPDKVLTILDSTIMVVGFLIMLLSPDGVSQIGGACLVALGLFLLIVDGRY